MEKKNQTNEAPKKPSYEELNGYVNELMMENRNLHNRLNQVMNVHNKLPWLFEIIKMKEVFGADYVDAAIKEIQLIIPPFKESVPEEAESDTVTSPKED